MNENIYSDSIVNPQYDDQDSALSKLSSRYETKNSRVELNISKEKGYIRRNFNRNWLKSSLIVGGLLIGTSVLAVVIYYAVEEHEKKENIIPFTEGLAIVDDYFTWIYSLNMKESIRLRASHKNNIAMDVHYGQSLFLYEDKASTITDILNNKTSANCSRQWNLHAFAINYLTQQFYIIDKFLRILIVLDMQSTYYGVVRSDLIKPHDIVLDMSAGYLFISQKDHSIFRSDMDGTNVQIIKNNQTRRISSISIDIENKQIFWSNDYDGIFVGDYEGLNVFWLHSISEQVFSMTYINNQLFFLLQPISTETKASLSSCTIGLSSKSEKICRNYKHYSTSLKNPRILKSFSNIKKDIHNPCEKNKDNCTHLCLLASNGRSSCVCKLGWELHGGSKTDCTKVSSSLIYIENNEFIRLKVIENIQDGAFVDVALPISVQAKTLTHKVVLDFDYDLENQTVYISDDKEISKKVIAENSTQVSLYKVEQEFENIRDLALDWITKNLYFAVEGKVYPHGYIGIINVKGATNKLKKIIFADCPHSLIIHPNLGYIYYLSNLIKQGLVRMSLMVSDIVNYKTTPFYNVNKRVALDYQYSLIYWAHLNEKTRTYICFSDVEFLTKEKCDYVQINATSLYVYKNYLYAANRTHIFRYNKTNFSDPFTIVPTHFENDRNINTSDVKIISPAIQTKDGENKCEINNGGCEQFCFQKPKFSCG